MSSFQFLWFGFIWFYCYRRIVINIHILPSIFRWRMTFNWPKSLANIWVTILSFFFYSCQKCLLVEIHLLTMFTMFTVYASFLSTRPTMCWRANFFTYKQQKRTATFLYYLAALSISSILRYNSQLPSRQHSSRMTLTQF